MNRRTVLFTGAAVVAMLTPGFADDTLQASADIREAALSIAGPSLDAKLGGENQNFVRFITFAAAANSITISGIGVLNHPDDDLALEPSTAALVLLRANASNPPPHGRDDRFVRKGVVTLLFCVADAGWEIGRVNGVVSVRAFTASKLGDWQPFQSDPGKYRR